MAPAIAYSHAQVIFVPSNEHRVCDVSLHDEAGLVGELLHAGDEKDVLALRRAAWFANPHDGLLLLLLLLLGGRLGHRPPQLLGLPRQDERLRRVAVQRSPRLGHATQTARQTVLLTDTGCHTRTADSSTHDV